MKRRSFLQILGGAIAAAFAPRVAAEEVATETIGDLVWTTTDTGKILNVTKRPIYSGDICVWNGAEYRPAESYDLTHIDLADSEWRTAVAVSDGRGGFHFARYPNCIHVEMDIEIHG